MANNPFTPIFGAEPLVLAGRGEILEDMRFAFSSDGLVPNLCSIIVGPRGTGKTALLSSVATIAGENGWLAVRSPALPGLLQDVLLQVQAVAKEHLDHCGDVRLTGVSLGGVLGVQWEHREDSANWRLQMDQLISGLNEKGIGLLIQIDEVDPGLSELTTLVSVFQCFIGERKRVALCMAGLPGSVNALVAGPSTSFLRRARQLKLSRIADEQVAAALLETVGSVGVCFQPAALDCAVEAAGGFAYMIQLVGYWSFRAWEKNGGNSSGISLADVRTGIRNAQDDMRQSVLQVTFRDLSDGDLSFLAAMLADDGPSRMSSLAKRLNVSQSYASQYRLRLIAQGVIGQCGRGKVDFEIPGFRQYVRESMMLGDFDIPEGASIECSPAEYEEAAAFVDGLVLVAVRSKRGDA